MDSITRSLVHRIRLDQIIYIENVRGGDECLHLKSGADMAKPDETIWEIEPHTLAKHEILRRYLGAWFPILATQNSKLIYFDKNSKIKWFVMQKKFELDMFLKDDKLSWLPISIKIWQPTIIIML